MITGGRPDPPGAAPRMSGKKVHKPRFFKPGRPPAPDPGLRRHSPAAGGLPPPPARPDGPVTNPPRQPRLPGGHDQPGAICGGPPGRPCGDDCKPDTPPAVLADALGVSPGAA